MRTLILLVIVAGKLFGAAPVSSWSLDLSHCDRSVEFLAIARPGGLKVKGEAKQIEKKGVPLEGSLKIQAQGVTGSLSFVLDALDTGIELRNKHMKEKCLETTTFPKADFSLSKMELPTSFSLDTFSQEDIPFQGQLLIKALKKPFSGLVLVKKNLNTVEMTFKGVVKLSDYAIEPPQFMGVKVQNDVDVSVTVKGQLRIDS